MSKTFEVNQDVWWHDPDEDSLSGIYQVVDQPDEETLFLTDESGTELQVPVSEVSGVIPTAADLILRAANRNYSNGELYLHKPIPDGQRGDGLADFIANEIKDVLKGENGTAGEKIDISLEAIENAIDQLHNIQHLIDYERQQLSHLIDQIPKTEQPASAQVASINRQLEPGM